MTDITPMIDPTEKRMTVRDCGNYFDIWRDEVCIASCLDYSNAAFIVRACNNHQALLEIAKEVQSALGRLAEQGLAGQAFNALLSKINTAIANDEKE